MLWFSGKYIAYTLYKGDIISLFTREMSIRDIAQPTCNQECNGIVNICVFTKICGSALHHKSFIQFPDSSAIKIVALNMG